MWAETASVNPEADHSGTGIIEVDNDDPGYVTNTSRRSPSLAASLHGYLEENGRRYHAYYGPDKNMMPTDDVEQERLDIHHEVFLLICGGDLYKAPVEKPQRALDLGTGTGIWAIDFAHDHPEAEVIGLDLSPIQPTWVPPNCRFEVDDFELPWTSPEAPTTPWSYFPAIQESFDYIHGRNVCHSVKDWPKLTGEVMSHLKPGAWFELAEVGTVVTSDDNSVPADWPPKRCNDLVTEGIKTLGGIVPDSDYLKKLLVESGFVDITVKAYKHPLTAWAKNKALKQAGALCTLQSDSAYHAYLMSLLTRVLGWTAEDADATCKAAHAAHLEKNTGIHPYTYFHVAYGRKPFASG